jgi:exonuclease VII small subunit
VDTISFKIDNTISWLTDELPRVLQGVQAETVTAISAITHSVETPVMALTNVVSEIEVRVARLDESAERLEKVHSKLAQTSAHLEVGLGELQVTATSVQANLSKHENAHLEKTNASFDQLQVELKETIRRLQAIRGIAERTDPSALSPPAVPPAPSTPVTSAPAPSPAHSQQTPSTWRDLNRATWTPDVTGRSNGTSG